MKFIYQLLFSIYIIVTMLVGIRIYSDCTKPDKTYLGIVQSKHIEPHYNKGGSYNSSEYLLVINFPPIGLKTVTVDKTSYYSKHKNDNVTYVLSDEFIYGKTTNDLIYTSLYVIWCFTTIFLAGFIFTFTPTLDKKLVSSVLSDVLKSKSNNQNKFRTRE